MYTIRLLYLRIHAVKRHKQTVVLTWAFSIFFNFYAVTVLREIYTYILSIDVQQRLNLTFR